MRVLLLQVAAALLLCSLWMSGSVCVAQADGGETIDQGQEVLQSLFVPFLAHAPFSLVLKTEWVRNLNNGGTFTLVNQRPIKRDSRGRLYQERWSLIPKGSKAKSFMTWIQIADPNERTLLQCNPRQRLCTLDTLNDPVNLRMDPTRVPSGPMPNGDGSRTHEDLGATSVAGVPVHHFRDTTTLNPGVNGNDLPMVFVRDYRFSPELGFNLTSLVDNPHFGKQIFTVDQVSTAEPDPQFFEAPDGYAVLDRRKHAKAAPGTPD